MVGVRFFAHILRLQIASEVRALLLLRPPVSNRRVRHSYSSEHPAHCWISSLKVYALGFLQYGVGEGHAPPH